jgi:hypothetical protein
MIRQIRIFLWGIISELEYMLYPWNEENKPPEETIKKFNLPETPFDENLHYDWLKSHDDKINRLQEEMIWVQKEIHRLNEKQN